MKQVTQFLGADNRMAKTYVKVLTEHGHPLPFTSAVTYKNWVRNLFCRWWLIRAKGVDMQAFCSWPFFLFLSGKADGGVSIPRPPQL